jgi:hypothetical protein
VVLSLTIGVGGLKLDPVIVILFVARLGVALLMTGPGEAYVRGGALAVVKANAAMMSAILGEDLQWFFIGVGWDCRQVALKASAQTFSLFFSRFFVGKFAKKFLGASK